MRQWEWQVLRVIYCWHANQRTQAQLNHLHNDQRNLPRAVQIRAGSQTSRADALSWSSSGAGRQVQLVTCNIRIMSSSGIPKKFKYFLPSTTRSLFSAVSTPSSNNCSHVAKWVKTQIPVNWLAQTLVNHVAWFI